MGAKWFWKVQMYWTPCRNEFGSEHIDAEPEPGCSGGTKNCELCKKWVGSRIKDQIDVQLKGSLSSEVHHSNLIRLKWALPRKESAFCVTGNKVYLKESLSLVILCGELPTYYTEMRELLHLIDDDTLATLIQKMKSGDVFKSWFYPQGICHLKSSSFNIFHRLRRQRATFGRKHLLPHP